MTDTGPAVTADGTSAALAALAGVAHEQVRAIGAQGRRLDQHGRTLRGHDQSINAHTGQINELRTTVDGHSIELAALAGVADTVATHEQRLDGHDADLANVTTVMTGHQGRIASLETWRNRVDGDFPWLFWGGISAAGFLLSMLWWRFVLYATNWHPWLEDRGGPNWWENNQTGVLNAHWWVIVLATTGVIMFFAWALVPRESQNDEVDQDANGARQPANQPTRAQQAANQPANTAPDVVAPAGPPPIIDEPAPQPVTVA